MLDPKVTEIIRAGNSEKPLPSNQRDLVALSLLLKPSPKARGSCD